jgi:RNA-binding protein 8A
MADTMEVDATDGSNGNGDGPIPIRSVEGWIILLTNLHEEVTEEDLQNVFGAFGSVRNLHLNLDRRTGYVKGYALLEYSTKEEAEKAVAEGDGEEILGMKCRAGWCFVRTPVAEGKGGGGGKGGKSGGKRGRSRSPERK